MGLFNKKKVPTSQNLPSLPELPKLPDLPSMHDGDDKQIHKLPSFPSSSLGKKFSQDTIKGAVSGEEEDEGKANEFANYDEDEDEEQTMPEPLKKPMTREVGSEERRSIMASTEPYAPAAKTAARPSVSVAPVQTRGAEPVFIRVDKFEGAMQIFNQTRKKMDEIEKILGDIKNLKDKEDQELTSWENEIMALKDKIEKVNADIFSKV